MAMPHDLASKRWCANFAELVVGQGRVLKDVIVTHCVCDMYVMFSSLDLCFTHAMV